MAGRKELIAALLVCGIGLATVVLRVLALWNEHWMHLKVESTDIWMSLSACKSCPEGKSEWSWSCFTANYCGLEGENPLCRLFSAGSAASFNVNLR